MTKLQQLEAEARKALATAKELGEKSGERTLTDTERADFDAAMAKGRELLDSIKAAKADEAVLAEAKSLADILGPEVAADVEAQKSGDQGDPRGKVTRKSLGEQVIQSDQFQSLMKSFNGRVPEKTRIQTDPIQVKSLFTGASETSAGAFVNPEYSDIVEMLGRRPLKIRDLISVRRTNTDLVYFVRQTSHTNNAAPVAEATSSAAPTTGASSGAALTLNAGGGYKPEGAWAFEQASTAVKTIAEWVPASKRALSDWSALEGLINDELRQDLAEEEEDQILNGNGTGENLDGITNVSGTQSQAWSSDFFTTTRKAVTKARVVGRVTPNGWLFSPGDVETLELLRNNEGNYYNGGPFAPAQRTLWGIPYVETEALSDGEGWLGDFKKAVLWDRQQATVTVTDSHADFFIRNLVAVLGEQREAFAVTRPSAFVAVDTAA